LQCGATRRRVDCRPRSSSSMANAFGLRATAPCRAPPFGMSFGIPEPCLTLSTRVGSDSSPMARALNFNAGPAALPLAALERAQAELLDFASSGMSVMEHSHRGKEYEAVHKEAGQLVREIYGVPDDFDVLFLQGGASQ